MRKFIPQKVTEAQKQAAHAFYADAEKFLAAQDRSKVAPVFVKMAAVSEIKDDLPWHVHTGNAAGTSASKCNVTPVHVEEDLPQAGTARKLNGDALWFVTAGRAIFTLVSTASGKRFTYRVSEPKNPQPGKDVPLFVSVLTGPDNCASYSYAGCIWDRGTMQVKSSAKAQVKFDAPSMLALRWWLKAVVDKDAAKLAQVEVWHEGRCCRCGRKLTVPSSIASGIGPECASKGE